MSFTVRFNELAVDMSEFLKGSSVEELVRHGFRVGTASKFVLYSEDDLKNTTINTLKKLSCVISDVRGCDFNDRFSKFLDDAFVSIVRAPRSELIKSDDFAVSTLACIRSKGLDGNYQTSKFLIIADKSYEINYENDI